MEEPVFSHNFWGDKHLGFDAMYLNMKHGSKATSDLLEFLRESCSIEDAYIKSQAKLAKQVNNYTNSGAFTPCWTVVHQLIETLSAVHMNIMQEWQTLLRDVQRYLEEQNRRHKAIKDGEVGSQEIVRAFQSASAQLIKAKDLFHTRYGECEKTRRNESSSAREIERAENKLKKAQDEYKYHIERYNNLRQQFYNKICDSCGHFQEVEQNHLDQMRGFLRNYGKSWKKSHQEIGKMVTDFERLYNGTTVDRLIKSFVADKGTGSNEPQPAIFEEPELTAAFAGNNSDIQSGSDLQQRAASATNERMTRKNSVSDLVDRVSNYSDRSITNSELSNIQTGVLPPPLIANQHSAPGNTKMKRGGGEGGSGGAGGGGFFNRRRRNSLTDKSKKKNKAAAAVTAASGTEPITDEHGFSIIPSNPWGNKETSSSSSSDDEDDPTDKTYKDLKFEIKPLSNQSSVEKQAQVVLSTSSNRNTPTLIPAPAPVAGRAAKSRSVTPMEANMKKSASLADQLQLASPTSVLPPTNGTDAVNLWEDGGGGVEVVLRKRQGDVHSSNPLEDSHRSSSLRKRGSSASESLDTLTPLASVPPTTDLINLAALDSPPPPSQPPPSANNNGGGSGLPLSLFGPGDATVPPAVPTRPRPTSTVSADPWSSSAANSAGQQGHANTFATNFENSPSLNSSRHSRRPPPRCETPDSMLNTWGDARGPSPVPLGRSDPVPLAVAFTETWHARYVGSSSVAEAGVNSPVNEAVESRVTGELSMAFPVGILRNLTDPSNPPKPLLFRITNAGRVRRLVINAKLVSDDLAGPEMYQLSMNMTSLINQLRVMREQNPSSKYFNVDLIKYEVVVPPGQQPPIELSTYWKCEEDKTDFHLDYTTHWSGLGTGPINPEVRLTMPVDGGVSQMQSLPAGAWSGESQKATWRLGSEAIRAPKGVVRAKFSLDRGPGSPQPLSLQFVCEGVHLSGAEFSLTGTGYRLSLSKKRLISGKYSCETEQGVRFV